MARHRSARYSGKLFRLTCLAVFLGSAGVAPAAAQRRDAGVSLELFGGAVTYGRFLEQLASEGVGAPRERELRGETNPTFGGSLGFFASFWGIDDVAVRAGFQFAKSDFRFEDDDPRETDELELAEAGELTNYIASLTVMKFFGDADAMIAPYGIAGGNATWWELDDPEPGAAGIGRVLPTDEGNERIFRWGPSGGFGLQLRPADVLVLRLETMRHAVGNPFDGDGDEAFFGLDGNQARRARPRERHPLLGRAGRAARLVAHPRMLRFGR